MIIENVPYTRQVADVVCATSACLHMLLTYHGYTLSPDEIADGYWEALRSGRFYESVLFSHARIPTESVALYCAAQYLATLQLRSTIFRIETSKIFLTYTKRKIPTLVAGRFPVVGGKVQNTILIKGYVGKYAIVNDPKGNALTHYIERMGENMLYPIELLEEWVGKETDIVRIDVSPQ